MNSYQPLPWQGDLLADLLRQHQAGQLGHALLVSGPAGVGKATLVRSLVATILCDQGSEGHACGQCPPCVQLEAGSHPDLLWVKRREDERSGKLKRDIAIDQVREMIERLSLAAQYGRGKFAVIDRVDELNVAGRNAILKTLEEPPPATVLILLSERPLGLPATVRSRCRRLRVPPPSRDAAEAWLQAQGLDDTWLTWAGGAPLQVAAWAAEQTDAHFRRWEQGLSAIAQDRGDPLSVSAEIGRDAVPLFVEWLIRWLHQMLRKGLLGERVPVPAAFLEPVITEALAARGELAGNVNPQLVLESLLGLWWRQTRLATRAVQSA